ncbi:MAG: lipid A export permease/ATP-binding protein MsbA [Xanthomonadales bacterium]|nr:lipid A export permease/ATP-binding protein MsbA [Xanthomonadales bacterium]
MSEGATPTIPVDRAWPIYARLLRYTRAYWPVLLLAMLGMLADAGATAGFTALLKPLLDDALLAGKSDVIRQMPYWVALVFLVRGLGGFVAEYAMSAVGRSVIRDLRQQLFDQYLRLPAAFYDRHSTGQLIARLTYNIEQVAEASTNAITVVVKDSLYVVFLVGVMFLQSVKLTLATLLIGPVIALFISYISRRFRRLSRKIQDSVSDVSHRAGEIVAGHREVKIYGGQAQEEDVFGEINANNRRQHLKLVATKAASASLIQLLAGLALAVIVYLATLDSMEGSVTPGSFIAFMTAMLGILPSLKKLTNVHVMIQRGVAAAESVFVIMDLPSEREDGGKPVGKVDGRLSFDSVGLAYADGEQVLSDISFEAHPGTVTAIVGRSGSGKTSLVSLVTRFYPTSAGRILLDDRDIAEFRLADYRDRIGYVGQDVVLFDDTVSRNIAYGRLAGASEEAIRDAARRANALEFIDRLPQGLQTRIGESGIQLSGGQRQRVAIARAILKDAPILILDEATSALDTESERAIQKGLEEVMRNKTTLVIAHRLSTIENADQVIVLDQGRLVEQGTHRELLERDGHYAALHRMQFHDPVGAADD